MKRALFQHQVVLYKSRQVILIEDMKGFFDDNRRSVIADMRNVMDHIEMVEQLRAEHCVVLVKGTCLTWDAWNARTGEFSGFSKLDWTSAFQAFIYLQLQPQSA